MQRRMTEQENDQLAVDLIYPKLEEYYGQHLINIDFDRETFGEELSALLTKIRTERSRFEDGAKREWKKLYTRLRNKDTSVPEPELYLATSLVFDCAIVLMSCSPDVLFNDVIASALVDAEFNNNPKGAEDRIEALECIALPEEERLTQWVVDFLAGDEAETSESGTIAASAQNEHPLEPYIKWVGQVDKVIEWLHRSILGKKTPKEQLAPLKAAMECTPRAVNNSVTVEVFNAEFDLDVSADTYKNWIKGYHSYLYSDGELSGYTDELMAIKG